MASNGRILALAAKGDDNAWQNDTTSNRGSGWSRRDYSGTGPTSNREEAPAESLSGSRARIRIWSGTLRPAPRLYVSPDLCRLVRRQPGASETPSKRIATKGSPPRSSRQPWAGHRRTRCSAKSRAATKEYDVEIFEVGGYRNILHPDEQARQANLKYLAQCLENAEKLGCRMVGTITGSRNPEGNEWADNYAVHPDNWTLETWKLTVSGIKQILKDTAGLKAALGMEAQVTTNLDGPVAHRNLMEDVGDPRCKVNLDPTNMVHLANHFHTTELINDCFDLLGENIYGCHAKDSYVLPHSQTVHVQEVRPGGGSLDYETYLVRISRLEWPRALCPEHFPADQFPAAYAFLRKTAAKVGVRIHG